jgi:hypothetical protein
VTPHFVNTNYKFPSPPPVSFFFKDPSQDARFVSVGTLDNSNFVVLASLEADNYGPCNISESFFASHKTEFLFAKVVQLP